MPSPTIPSRGYRLHPLGGVAIDLVEGAMLLVFLCCLLLLCVGFGR